MQKKITSGDRIKVIWLNYSVSNHDEGTKDYVLEKGDLGTVVSIKHIKNFFNNGKGYHQIWVKWDKDGKEFPLIQEQDAFDAYKPKYDLGYSCCKCGVKIADQEIPDEVKGKIGMQLVWHNSCA